jgi:hypothetical protein
MLDDNCEGHLDDEKGSLTLRGAAATTLRSEDEQLTGSLNRGD